MVMLIFYPVLGWPKFFWAALFHRKRVHAARKTLTGACVITRQVAAMPLMPTNKTPSSGPASHSVALK